MKVAIAFKGIKHSEAVEEKIHEKCHHLEKMIGEELFSKWTCYEKEGIFYTELHVNGPKINYHSKAYGENLYKTFDSVVEKMERQLEKKKDKFKNKIHYNPNREIVILDPEMAWTDRPDYKPKKHVA